MAGRQQEAARALLALGAGGGLGGSAAAFQLGLVAASNGGVGVGLNGTSGGEVVSVPQSISAKDDIDKNAGAQDDGEAGSRTRKGAVRKSIKETGKGKGGAKGDGGSAVPSSSDK
jgi:hypothetical protein